MSEHIQSGRRQRQQRDEARDLLKMLRTENPEADRAALIRLYMDQAEPAIESSDDPELIRALLGRPTREWLGAEISEPKPKAAKKTREEREAAKAAKAAMVEEIAERDADRVEAIVMERRLLEWEIIDGQRLGNLTGADCRNLSERFGVFFHVISDNIPPRAKVRNRYTELELQALARHHKLIVP